MKDNVDVDIMLRETEPKLVGQVVRVLWEELAEVEVKQPLGKPSHHLHNHRHYYHASSSLTLIIRIIIIINSIMAGSVITSPVHSTKR